MKKELFNGKNTADAGAESVVIPGSGGWLFNAFWEVEPALKCPVVGLGISDEEGRRILKKSGRRVKGLAPWEVHRDLMESVGEETPVARRVDAYLKRRYAEGMAATSSLPEKRLLPFLKAGIARGDAGEALYCVAMRKNLAGETLMTLCGEAHMMGHTTAVDLLQARRKGVQSAGKINELTGALEAERRERRRLVRELDQAMGKANALLLQLDKMNDQPPVVPAAPVADDRVEEMERALKVEVARRHASESERDVLQAEGRKLEREKRKLQIRGMELANENKALADEVMHLAIGRPAPPLKVRACEGRGCSTCPEVETCSRRVLMVGGLSRMEPHYRRVAEAKGLGFEYHDGTMSGGRKYLENQVSRCDMVVCPVTCNSHNACRSVKKLCAKHNKEIRFLPTSSISALTGVLHDMPN